MSVKEIGVEINVQILTFHQISCQSTFHEDTWLLLKQKVQGNLNHLSAELFLTTVLTMILLERVRVQLQIAYMSCFGQCLI